MPAFFSRENVFLDTYFPFKIIINSKHTTYAYAIQLTIAGQEPGIIIHGHQSKGYGTRCGIFDQRDRGKMCLITPAVNPYLDGIYHYTPQYINVHFTFGFVCSVCKADLCVLKHISRKLQVACH